MRLQGQPSLPFEPLRGYPEADFRVAPSNAEAVAWLSRTADWPQGRLALWGDPARGKTHLLHVWAARNGAELRSGPALHGLTALPAAGGIALDEASEVPDEAALLHLLNAAAEAGLPVLMAARTPPARWTVALPDLASRLRAVLAVEIGPPDDDLLRALLARLLAARQLRLSEAVQLWLLRRLPRSATALAEAVVRLDAAGMEAHRDITIPFAREVLADLEQREDEISQTGHGPSPGGTPL
jgi:chromosomal replication initiation ATPase DnaA